MSEVPHQPCPFVECGSSDAFSWNTEGYGFCHSCEQSYPKKGAKVHSWANKDYPVGKPKGDDLFNVGGPPVENDSPAVENGKFISYRGVSPSTMEFFGVRTDGNKQAYVYPSGGIKYRNIESKEFWAKGLNSSELFGMNLFTAGSSRMVTVTEGELDALSAYQMLAKGSYINPVVSLPSATPSRKLWENCKPWLDSFDKIILSVDNDDRGDDVADKMSRLFPGKVHRVDHGKYKDANEFLQAGAGQEFKSAWWNARRHTPKNVLHTPEDFLGLYNDTPDHQFVPTGIEALDDKILGLMQGQFTVVKAPTGIGKTEFMRFLEYSMWKQDVPFASWHLEETKTRSLLGLVSYHLNDNLTRRDLILEKGANDRVTDAITELTSKELYYQFFLGDGEGSNELISQIRFFKEACGVKYVFFEPIQDVVAGLSETSKEETLADLSVRLSKVAAELNVGIVTIAHTNEDGDPKYCKMIGQRASVILDLKRNKDADDYEESNTTQIWIEKNRPTSEEGPGGKMRFSTSTFTLKEVW